MRASAGFLLRFLAIAAVLFALWTVARLSDAYGRAVVVAANPLIRLCTGFQVTSTVPTSKGLDVVIGRGDLEVLMPFQPRELFSGVIPFLALVCASAGLTLPRRMRAMVIGACVMFAFHVGLMVIGPYMTGHPQAHLPIDWVRRVNMAIDVFYGFYGLVGYAALPFLLWYWLAYQSGGQGRDR